MVEMKCYKSRDEWLKARTSCIGGSDAACIIGANPWKTSEQLWEEKLGLRTPDDLSENKLVQYGNNAEHLLRELFALDYPKFDVMYCEHNMFTNSDYPFAHASLDGWIGDRETSRTGILEIKTATISSAAQSEKWKGNNIPQNYYAQILHYFLVTGFSFAILKAQLKYEIAGEEPFLHTKHYRIERSDVEDDILYLANAERGFHKQIVTKTRPNIVLPQI